MKVLAFVLAIFLVGCSENKIDTFPEYCEQITGNYKAPFWAFITSTSQDDNAIRDSYTDMLNKTHLEKVNNRTPRMAWRVGEELHLVNLSSFMIIEPNEVISQWEKGINIAKQYLDQDDGEVCLYGTLTSMFNSLNIHSMESDPLGIKWSDKVTVITTDREAKKGMKTYKEIEAFYSKKDKDDNANLKY